MCVSTRGGVGGDGVVLPVVSGGASGPQPHPPHPKPKTVSSGENEILNRDPKMRGPFQVHRLFLHSCPPPHPSPHPPLPDPAGHSAQRWNRGEGAVDDEGHGGGRGRRRGVSPGGRRNTTVSRGSLQHAGGGGGGGGGMGNLGNPPDTPTPPTGPHQNDLLQGKRDLLKGLEV